MKAPTTELTLKRQNRWLYLLRMLTKLAETREEAAVNRERVNRAKKTFR